MNALLGAAATFLAAVSAASNFVPIPGFNENREHFYRHEQRQAYLNKEIATYTSDNLRIGHFDSHWHGMSTDEYLTLFHDTKADVLIARGVPEREGVAEVVRGRLIAAGLDKSTVVESPCAALTSGLAIGVRNGVVVEQHSFLSLDGTYVAAEVTLKLGKPTARVGNATLKLLVVLIEALDSKNRVTQLNFVERRVKELNDQKYNLMVLGGFHNNLKDSPEARAIKKTGALTDVFTSNTPAYTSWWGKRTDTAYVNSNTLPALRDANVWHAPTDCLPILVDFHRSTLETGIVPRHTLAAVPAGSAGSRFEKIRRVPAWLKSFNWKMIGLGVGGILAVIIVILVAFKLLRSRGCNGKRIQATGKFADADLKVTKVSNTKKQQFSDEKH